MKGKPQGIPVIREHQAASLRDLTTRLHDLWPRYATFPGGSHACNRWWRIGHVLCAAQWRKAAFGAGTAEVWGTLGILRSSAAQVFCATSYVQKWVVTIGNLV